MKRPEASLAPFLRVTTTLRGLDLPGHCLRRVAAPFDFDGTDPSQRRAITRGLLGTLYAPPPGVGLAAPMAGLDMRVVIALDGKRVLVMFNPEILETAGKSVTYPEGNLCVPGVSAEVTRPTELTVRWHDMQRRQHEETFGGWLARVLFHEIEILDGKMFTDSAEPESITVLDRVQRAADLAAEAFGDQHPPTRPTEDVLGLVTLPPDLLTPSASVLRRKTEDVDLAAIPAPELRGLIHAMYLAQYRIGGVGLAAPQVGIGLRLSVIDDRMTPLILINPRVLDQGGDTELDTEGCLSIVARRGEVRRSTSIRILNHAPDGEPKELELTGHIARIVQHEIDHLDGILYTDRMDKTAELALAAVDPDTRVRSAYKRADEAS
jgi:peptide deformylase